MIPLHLVTGFLGSGKTTYLARLADDAQRDPHTRTIFLVNEFSPTDLDADMIHCPPQDLAAIAGGSIFCTCKVTDFSNALHTIAARGPSDDAPCHRPADRVVIEASGIADPRVLARLLTDAKLDDRFLIASITCIVDPQTLDKLLNTLPNIKTQIQSAGLILLNKTDLCPASLTDHAERTLRELNPTAVIHRCIQCAPTAQHPPQHDSPLTQPAAPLPPADPAVEYARCADPNFVLMHIETPPGVSLGRIAAAIEEALPDLYRVKGLIGAPPPDPAVMRIEASIAGVDIRPMDRPESAAQDLRAPLGRLVVIAAKGADQRVTHAFTNHLPCCVHIANAPASINIAG